MGVIRHKIWFELWNNKSRTLQVVLIIAMGAASIGMILGIRNLVIPAMEGGWKTINPAMINLFVGPSMDDDELEALRTVDGVALVEGVSNSTIEWRVSPDDEWQSGGLTARDYDDQTLNRLELVSGEWPEEKIFGVEQGAEAFFGIPERGEITLRIDNKEHTVQFGSTIYNQLANPPSFGGTAQFYTSRDTYENLIGDRDFSQALITADIPYDEDAVSEIADRVQDKLDKQGKTSFRFLTDPDKHFFQDSMDGIFFVLGILGVLALILGLFLVYNTINALISQQIDQIGIMKAIGAGTGQILGIYLLGIMAYSVMALLIAVPLGVMGAWFVTDWLVSGFNADSGGFAVSTDAILVQVGIALVAPLLASLIPIIAGARITVREAISTYGLSTGGSLIDRLLAKSTRISRTLLLTISNTFRNKWRVVLTQITLVLSGLIFMMVVSVRDSVVFTIDDTLFAILNYNVSFAFEDNERISRVEHLTLAHPDVKAVEMWGGASGIVHLTEQEETEDDERLTVYGVPLPTDLYVPQMRSGRWLRPDDTFAVVLNEELAKDAGVTIGDWITMKYDGGSKETDWQVVGLLFDPIITDSAHVPREILLRETNSINKASSIWIQTHRTDAASEIEIAKELRRYLKDNQIDVSAQPGAIGFGGDSAQETAALIIDQFNFMIVLLAIMAVVIGMVGSIGLSGTLSLSVMERGREIGVMRAIGASSGVISWLFVGEGLLLGWLSWLIALPLGIPAGQAVVTGLGSSLGLNLVYHYTPVGAGLWLGVITALAIIASWFPARGATRISVRESLAYQ